MSYSKSNEYAELTRNAGNKFYSEHKFLDALIKYNESLCHAPVESEALGLAYANRSAVYYELRLYEKSLRSIQLAKANGYPVKNFAMLDRRAERCLEQIELGSDAMKDEENPYDFVKLSHEPNPRLPFVSNCLELRKDNKFGRYIVTNVDLHVGQIVAIEKPHFRVIKSDSRYESCDELNKFKRCVFCLSDNHFDLIPCDECTSTMFCSEKCQCEALASFHNFECLISAHLLKSGIMQMAMRVFFQALNIFDGLIEDIERFLESKVTSSVSYYDFDFSSWSDSNVMDKNHLTILYCLSKSNRYDESDSPRILLMRHPILAEIWNNHEAFITKFFQRILQIGDSNFHGISGWSQNTLHENSPKMIGIGCYPFISLVNHSCAPNVNRIYVENKMFLLVERPIKAGEQLFDCYR